MDAFLGLEYERSEAAWLKVLRGLHASNFQEHFFRLFIYYLRHPQFEDVHVWVAFSDSTKILIRLISPVVALR